MRKVVIAVLAIIAIALVITSALAQTPTIQWKKKGTTGKSQTIGLGFDTAGNMIAVSNDPTSGATTVCKSTDKGATCESVAGHSTQNV